MNDCAGAAVGYKRAMTRRPPLPARRAHDPPGHVLQPADRDLIVVDDSPEVDHEIFETDEFESTDWVLISEESPLDEHKRDDLVERFQRHLPARRRAADRRRRRDVEDEEDELEPDDDLELDRE